MSRIHTASIAATQKKFNHKERKVFTQRFTKENAYRKRKFLWSNTLIPITNQNQE